MPLPTFFVLGAAKSGTTSLYSYLRQHPRVFMSPIKEPNFFALVGNERTPTGPEERAWYEKSVTDFEEYKALFSEATEGQAIGEASPFYLYSPRAPRRIHAHVPKARLLAILRNPADAVYSMYLHHRNGGREPAATFEEALACEEQRLRQGRSMLTYTSGGFYYEQLRRYYDLFDEDQIRVYLFKEYTQDTKRVVQNIFGFIGIDSCFEPDVSRALNRSYRSKLRWIDALFFQPGPVRKGLKRMLPKNIRKWGTRVKEINHGRPAPLAPETRRRLIELYRDDITRLESLIDRDLSAWLH